MFWKNSDFQIFQKTPKTFLLITIYICRAWKSLIDIYSINCLALLSLSWSHCTVNVSAILFLKFSASNLICITCFFLQLFNFIWGLLCVICFLKFAFAFCNSVSAVYFVHFAHCNLFCHICFSKLALCNLLWVICILLFFFVFLNVRCLSYA